MKSFKDFNKNDSSRKTFSLLNSNLYNNNNNNFNGQPNQTSRQKNNFSQTNRFNKPLNLTNLGNNMMKTIDVSRKGFNSVKNIGNMSNRSEVSSRSNSSGSLNNLNNSNSIELKSNRSASPSMGESKSPIMGSRNKGLLERKLNYGKLLINKAIKTNPKSPPPKSNTNRTIFSPNTIKQDQIKSSIEEVIKNEIKYKTKIKKDASDIQVQNSLNSPDDEITLEKAKNEFLNIKKKIDENTTKLHITTNENSYSISNTLYDDLILLNDNLTKVIDVRIN